MVQVVDSTYSQTSSRNLGGRAEDDELHKSGRRRERRRTTKSTYSK
jgi:hypothetical protein